MNIIPDLITIAPLLALGYLHRRVSRSGSFVLVLTNVPITIMHELAHFTVAVIFGAEPTGFSLWPKRAGNRWVLGSVTARVTTFSAAPTACAPLLWLLVGGVVLVERRALSGGSLYNMGAVYLAAYLCIAAGIPSWQDIKVALSFPLGLLLWLTAFAATIFFLYTLYPSV